MKIHFVKRSVSSILILVLGAGVALSQESTDGRQASGRPEISAATAQPVKDWAYSLGVGAFVKPKYKGSSSYEIMPIPYFDVEYKKAFYFSPARGLGYRSDAQKKLSYNVGLGYDFGRDEEDGKLLNGLGDIDFSGLLRAGVNYDVGPFKLGLDLRKAVTGAHDGYEAEGSVQKTMFLRRWKTLVTVGIKATFSSEEYLQTYLGVNEQQAADSMHSVYELDSGIKEIGLSAMVIRRLSPRWSLMILANYGKLVGDVADSPIIETDDRFFSGLFAVRKF